MDIPVRNPRSGEIDYHLRCTPAEALPGIAGELRAAQPAWEAIGLEGRLEVLRAWCAEVDKIRGDLLDALVRDTGRLAESEKELQRLPSSLDKLAVMAREVFVDRPLELRSMPSVRVHGGWRPYPLVGVISPWNFPLSSSLLDTLPALVAGCAALVKPSEITPRFVEPLVASLRRVPEMHAVLRYVNGGPDIGAALVQQVDAISFTGSVPTGQKVAEAAGRAFIPAFLELGGKDPAIVTADADLALAARAILAGSVSNCGQVCVSLERIYVDARVHDAFVDTLVSLARAVKPAYPTLADGTLGPIILPRQAEKINAHLQDALDQGAVLRCGGKVTQRDGGWWAEPTVLTCVHHGMQVMTEETFGPLMPVMSYDTLDEAIALANDSSYGLSGAVFAGNDGDALAIARRMQVGAISINSTGLGTAAIGEGDWHEKNAFGHSGLAGSRLGYDSLTRFTRKQAFLLQR